MSLSDDSSDPPVPLWSWYWFHFRRRKLIISDNKKQVWGGQFVWLLSLCLAERATAEQQSGFNGLSHFSTTHVSLWVSIPSETVSVCFSPTVVTVSGSLKGLSCVLPSALTSLPVPAVSEGSEYFLHPVCLHPCCSVLWEGGVSVWHDTSSNTHVGMFPVQWFYISLL